MKKPLILLAILLSLLSLFLASSFSSKKNPDESSFDRVIRVSRKDMTVKITENGSLQAVRYHSVMAGLDHYDTTLKSIIPEGSQVTKDQVIATLEIENIQEQIDDMENKIKNAHQRISVAKQDLEVQHVVVKNTLEQMKSALETSKKAYLKYKDFEGPKLEKNIRIKIDKAQTELDDATRNLKETLASQEDELFVEEEEEIEQAKILETSRRQVDSAKDALEVEKLEEKIFKLHTYPDQISALKSAYKTAKVNLQQEHIKAKASLLAKKTEYDKAKLELKSTEKRLEQLIKNQQALEVKSPSDGILIYGDPTIPWMRRQIKVGREIYTRYPIATIPDTGSYNVVLQIDETLRGKISLDLKTYVTFPALPDVSTTGKVTNIGNIAKPRDEFNPDSPKAYEVKILLDKAYPEMTQGMSAKTEIITSELKNVLTLPIEAIHYDDGKPYCYMNEEEKRELTLGTSNDSEVVILKGLSEEEEVLIAKEVSP